MMFPLRRPPQRQELSGKGQRKREPTYGLNSEENWEQWSHSEEEETENIGRLSGLTIALGKGPGNPAEIAKIIPKSIHHVQEPGEKTRSTARTIAWTPSTLVRQTSFASNGGATGAPTTGVRDGQNAKVIRDHTLLSRDLIGPTS